MRYWSALVAVSAGALIPGCVTQMPGRSHQGPLPPLSESQRSLAADLRQHVTMLASEIGRRNVEHPQGLARAEAYLAAELEAMGYRVERQTYPVKNVPCSNLSVELPGTSSPDQ